MRILINDANILIDLIRLACVDAFFKLDAEVVTTDFVLEELEIEQQLIFQNSNFRVLTSDSLAISEISRMKEQHPGLSFEDCYVWHHARLSGGVLVTGDGLLRKKARVEGIEVRGIIFLITELKTQNILGIQDCIRLLDKLKQINPRLPIQEIENLIYNWEMELNRNR